MEELSCPVAGCKYIVNGINKEDVLKQMAEHRTEHRVEHRRLAHGRKEGVSHGLRRHGVK